jgi:chromosome segregation ATPase
MCDAIQEKYDMSEQVRATEAEQATVENQAARRPAATRQQPNTISDPREVATVIMARMNLVNAKKDELTIAIKGLTDLTQQLAQAYAGQVQVIQQLANRVKALEEQASTNGANQPAAAPDKPIA